MIRAAGAVAVAVAALLVCCSADSHPEAENIGHKLRTLESSLGGGHLVRQVRESHHTNPWYLIGRYAYPQDQQPQYGRRDLWPVAMPVDYSRYYGEGLPKRNFDDADRSGMFVSRRNFDEIDQTSMPFPYATKRFVKFYENYIDSPLVHDGGDKRFHDVPMDEIDLSHFPIGSKRSGDLG